MAAYGLYSMRPVIDLIDKEVIAGEITPESVADKYHVDVKEVELAVIVMANSERLDQIEPEGRRFKATEPYRNFLLGKKKDSQ